jgi:hypothetical protein
MGDFLYSVRWLTGLLCGSSFFACKPQETTPVNKVVGTRPKDPMAGFYASSQTEVRAKNNFYYAIFKKDYERKFDALPATGEVTPERVPYVGGWYPQSKGGTNVRMRGLSPLEKYDAVFNANTTGKAADWERKNHTVDPNDKSSAWAGHCNGFSAAATRHTEPKKEVPRGSNIFYPEDIKALMAEIHMGAKFYFLGGNRCGLIESGSLLPPGSRQDPTTMGLCDDVNPGTFHVAIANWIGIQKYPIIADINGKEQVWNYPHWKYTVDSRSVTRSEANKIITGSADDSYRFNPDAKQFRSVALTVTRTEAVTNEIMTSQVAAAQRYKQQTYYYILEMNDAGEIIGGEWVSDSQRNHPDFIWVALETLPGDGSKYGSNPHLDPKEVLKLWAESVGVDPSNPPALINEPAMVTQWGRYPKFDITINGVNTGVAYLLENKFNIGLKVKQGLAGATPTLKLDGTPLSIDIGSNSATVNNPGPGLHVLEVKWTAGGKTVDEQRARIHAIR